MTSRIATEKAGERNVLKFKDSKYASSAKWTTRDKDLTMSDDPTLFRTPKGTMLSEVFKRPFSHPYALLQKGHGAHGH